MADTDTRHRAGHRSAHRAARRAAPRTQTWLMVGLALGILGIIVFTGHPEPAGRPTAPVASTPLAPNPDRLRDYQDRLRVSTSGHVSRR